MEEQKELHLKPRDVKKSIKEVIEVIEKQDGSVKLTNPPISQEQSPQIEWCGGMDNFSHDVTISLVPSRINLLFMVKHPPTKVKAHSSRLSRCSKYFEACLAERWRQQTSSPSTTDQEFVLETHADIACYVDCFSRMYKPPFFKDFRDVKYSVGLLKAASHIQFVELMESISLYLSAKLWSDEDEMLIRMYSSGDDFPRKHAQDLVVRLGIDESKEECHKRLCDMIEQCVRSALAYDGNFQSNRAFVKEMLPGCLTDRFPDVSAPSSGHDKRSSSVSSNPFGLWNGSSNGLMGNGSSNAPASEPNAHPSCTRDVVAIVNREGKRMLVKFGKECEGQTYLSVPRLVDKISAICWILETLLAAKVGEEFVECFVHLHSIPKILALVEIPTYVQMSIDGVRPADARNAAVELTKLVFVICREVVAGNLLLKTAERIALLQNWHSPLKKLLVGTSCNFDQARRDLFMTLPLKHQIEFFKARKDTNYESYISTDSLARLVKKQWPAVEVKLDASSPSRE